MVKKTQKLDVSQPLRRVVSVVRNQGVRQGEPHFYCVELNSKSQVVAKGMLIIIVVDIITSVIIILCFLCNDDDTGPISYVPCRVLQSVARTRPHIILKTNMKKTLKPQLKTKKRRRHTGWWLLLF